jgi:hypothetical protein
MSTARRNVGTASMAFANQVEPIMEKALQGKHQFAVLWSATPAAGGFEG